MFSLTSYFFGLLIPYSPLPGYFDFSFPFFSISVGFQVVSSSKLDSCGNILFVYLRILATPLPWSLPQESKIGSCRKAFICIYVFFKGVIVQF